MHLHLILCILYLLHLHIFRILTLHQIDVLQILQCTIVTESLLLFRLRYHTNSLYINKTLLSIDFSNSHMSLFVLM